MTHHHKFGKKNFLNSGGKKMGILGKQIFSL